MLLTEAANSGGSSLTIWIMMAALAGAMYFLMIRPQQKRTRQAAEMRSQMGPGDEVVTVGGLYGTILSVDDDTVMLEIAPDVVARYALAAISRVVESADQSDEDSESDEDPESTETTDDDEITVDKSIKRD